jgi:NAD(P)H-dependent nitrite reductase small subunit
LPVVRRQWVRLAAAADVPSDGGIAVRYGATQLALFHLESQGDTWYATQNECPHKRAMILARGIVGDQGGVPKVACPLHKKTFDLKTGACLTADAPPIATFPVRVENGDVWVELPPAEELETAAAMAACAAHASHAPVAVQAPQPAQAMAS